MNRRPTTRRRRAELALHRRDSSYGNSSFLSLQCGRIAEKASSPDPACALFSSWRQAYPYGVTTDSSGSSILLTNEYGRTTFSTAMLMFPRRVARCHFLLPKRHLFDALVFRVHDLTGSLPDQPLRLVKRSIQAESPDPPSPE